MSRASTLAKAVGPNGDISVSGNTTIGDASTDTVTFNAATASIPNGINFTNGNFGIGATPGGWKSNYKAVQFGNGGNLVGRTDSTALYLSTNWSVNSSNQDIYTANGYSALYSQSNTGQHVWYTAASGTAGGTISFIQSMTMDSSGRLGIGATSPTCNLDVQAANLDTTGFQFKSTTGTNAAAGRFNNTGGNAYIGLDNSAGTRISGSSNAGYALNLWHEGQYPILFGNGNVERARIDASGNVGINVIPAVSKLDVYHTSSANTVLTLFRGVQGNDNSLPVAFGSPYLKIGQTEWRSGSIQTIGFGYSPGSGKTSPAEIGLVTTNTAGQTYGDIVFATRTATTDTAPSERARIDSVGRFTVINQPAFAGRGASNGDAGYGVQSLLFKFGTIHTNTGTRYDTSTGLFTAPVAGNYLVTWNVLFDDSNSSTGQMAAIRVNGADRSWIYSSTALAYGFATLSTVVSLSANDTIGFYCYARVHSGSDTSGSICLLN